MEPVIVGAVVTVAVSVVKGIVGIAQGRVKASVERMLIAEAAHTDRLRCLISPDALASHPAHRCSGTVPHGCAGGDDRGGRPQH